LNTWLGAAILCTFNSWQDLTSDLNNILQICNIKKMKIITIILTLFQDCARRSARASSLPTGPSSSSSTTARRTCPSLSARSPTPLRPAACPGPSPSSSDQLFRLLLGAQSIWPGRAENRFLRQLAGRRCATNICVTIPTQLRM
jgi:hypothetical protein